MNYDISKIMRDAIELGVPAKGAFEIAIIVASAIAGAQLSIFIDIMADMALLSIHRMATNAEHELITNFQPQ